MKTTFLLLFLLSVYGLSGLFLFIQQDSFIYQPSKKINHPYPITTFLHNDASIEVITLNLGKKSALLYLGGSAESVVKSAPLYLKNFPNHTIYLVNYRGYGGSSGQPSEKAFYSDALYIFDQIQPLHTNLTVIGRSLGTAVATFVASQRMISGLILVTPYDSIQNIAQNRYPIYPMSLMLCDKFNALAHIKHIQANTLIVTAEHDETIPFKHSQHIINAFPSSQFTTKMIQKVGHNSIITSNDYFLTLKTFVHNLNPYATHQASPIMQNVMPQNEVTK